MNFNILLNRFSDLTDSPEQFLDPGVLSEEFKNFVKTIYDLSVTECYKSESALPELIVSNFDDEQIWQELELQNEGCLPKLIDNASKLLVLKSLSLPIKSVSSIISKKNASSSEQGYEETSEHDELSLGDDISEDNLDSDIKDDDDDASVSDEEDYDLFDENLPESDDDENRPTYKDFFDDPPLDKENVSSEKPDFYWDCPSDLDDNAEKKRKKKVRFNDAAPESEEELFEKPNENKKKSSFEKRETKLREKIAKLEEEALREKPWQMKGEVNSDVRPINSLLEEVVEFDMTQRPAPIITEETTNTLEEIIKRRIRDQAFNDVERKIKPVNTPHEFKKQLVLDQEKSKVSLAQIYEQEYLKQKESQTADGTDKVEEEPEEHKVIKQKMKWLFQKLDCLAGFYFVPRHVEPELQVVSNKPATSMEEVAPISSTDAKLLAPEEIAGKFRKSLVGKDERTRTDKKRARRKKKVLQSKKYKLQEEKNIGKPKTYTEELKKVTKFKNVSKLEEVIGKSTKTSKEFFSKLQQQSESKAIPSKRKNKAKHDISAKKLKL